MLTSSQIRQSFLDFFREKRHSIVPSSSLLPDSPNLLFTNAGMNQFVPIFLGQTLPDASTRANAIPSADTRAADTQKCIRAGGKHNDLEDVGLDTYHHTFFEMLGNWSFGDYFKKEAIEWAWELVVKRWGFPANRLYATIYQPDASKDDPAERDQEAWEIWAALFRSADLDPNIHIVNGNKKDNFWMMGDTGPCGPCSELHVDLTPLGDTKGALVNQGSARCIEIWNLVFIQFNANPDGTFSPLPAKHVDTGMGFERVCSIIQGTNNFTNFANARISNYETDVFRPLFDEIERLSGLKYGSTLPVTQADGSLVPVSDQEKTDVAFRVIADHIRTLSFAVADGIVPGNTDRNYVLRRILRRAIRYGRVIGLTEPFFYKLSSVLARTMGDVFPELRGKLKFVQDTLQREEESFNRTLDRGIALFTQESARAKSAGESRISGAFAFTLYDTSGFPVDLTELMARENGLSVDHAGFEALMEQQRNRARAAQKKQVIELSQIETMTPTKFVGFNHLETESSVLEVVQLKDRTAVILDASPAYAELGGQLGDSGEIRTGSSSWRFSSTRKNGETFLHFLDESEAPEPGTRVTIHVDSARRLGMERHHSVTHLLHWALREVIGTETSQKGSYVGPEKLTFDFAGAALSASQLKDVERLVNERILENSIVSWIERPYSEIKDRTDVLQFFGDKYGDRVRVVQIGGQSGALNGFSMELCGGTHTRATGEIGAFRIASESAIAAGIRRIEAIAGWAALEHAQTDADRLRQIASKIGTPLPDLDKKLDALLSRQKQLEKDLETLQRREAAATASRLTAAATEVSGTPVLVAEVPDATGDELQAVLESMKGTFGGVAVLGSATGGVGNLAALVNNSLTSRISAGKLIQSIAPLLGGKGGGRPDFARGAGKDIAKLALALDAARNTIQQALE
jgi:alanyl-tRNA synthetase